MDLHPLTGLVPALGLVIGTAYIITTRKERVTQSTFDKIVECNYYYRFMDMSGQYDEDNNDTWREAVRVLEGELDKKYSKHFGRYRDAEALLEVFKVVS